MLQRLLRRVTPALATAFIIAPPASALIELPTVLVGDPGNESLEHRGGGVDYEYYIGTYPVTNDQYVVFLNSVAAEDPHGLYNPEMASSSHGGIIRNGANGSYTYEVKEGFEKKPVNFVSFWDSARFANWLTNGQPVGPQEPGTTETGVYALNGVTEPFNSLARDAGAWEEGGVALANTDEWLKAAYYDPTKGESGGYWLYPTRTDDVPTPSVPNATNPNSANVDQAVGTVTAVGSYSLAQSYYGTFDQGGNVRERVDDPNRSHLRGGSFSSSRWSTGYSHVASFSRTMETGDFGFRVTSLERITESPPPEGPTFAEWRETQFTAAERENPEVSGALATPAGDGMENILKYAFGLDTKVPANLSDIVEYGGENGILRLVYPERVDAQDIEYIPEGTADLGLGAWDLGVHEVDRERENEEFDLVTVEAVLEDPADRGFIRVRVRQE